MFVCIPVFKKATYVVPTSTHYCCFLLIIVSNKCPVCSHKIRGFFLSLWHRHVDKLRTVKGIEVYIKGCGMIQLMTLMNTWNLKITRVPPIARRCYTWFVLESQKRYKIGCWQIAGVSNILQLAKQFGIYVWKGILRIIDLWIWTMV